MDSVPLQVGNRVKIFISQRCNSILVLINMSIAIWKCPIDMIRIVQELHKHVLHNFDPLNKQSKNGLRPHSPKMIIWYLDGLLYEYYLYIVFNKKKTPKAKFSVILLYINMTYFLIYTCAATKDFKGRVKTQNCFCKINIPGKTSSENNLPI